MVFKFTDIFRIGILGAAIVIMSTSKGAFTGEQEPVHFVLFGVAAIVASLMAISLIIRFMGGQSILSWIDLYWKGVVLGGIVGYIIINQIDIALPFSLPSELPQTFADKIMEGFLVAKSIVGSVIGALVGSIIQAKRMIR